MFGNECRGIPSSSGDALAATPLNCHEERGRHGSILPPVMAHQQVERTTGRDETMVFSEGPPSLWRCAAILPRAQEMQFSLASGQIWCPKVSKRRAESPLGAYPSGETDAPTPARVVGLPPRGGKYFLSLRKKVPKKASGTATPEAAHVASHCGQALRYACAWLRASWPSAISGASRPSASLGGGLRSAGAERLDAPNLFGASNSGP